MNETSGNGGAGWDRLPSRWPWRRWWWCSTWRRWCDLAATSWTGRS